LTTQERLAKNKAIHNEAWQRYMAKRKNLSNRTRFEVFKRDEFVCQYCGRKPPQVILQVDHIIPVSKGGDNEIINLITSCFDCNSGKSDIEIDDKITRDDIKIINSQNKEKQELLVLVWRSLIACNKHYGTHRLRYRNEIAILLLSDQYQNL
jgi:5-methylcytosine-specific restriction endonuclease McrA